MEKKILKVFLIFLFLLLVPETITPQSSGKVIKKLIFKWPVANLSFTCRDPEVWKTKPFTKEFELESLEKEKKKQAEFEQALKSEKLIAYKTCYFSEGSDIWWEPDRFVISPEKTFYIIDYIPHLPYNDGSAKARITIIDSNFKLVNRFTVEGIYVHSSADFDIDSKGNIYVWNGARGGYKILKYSPQGELLLKIGKKGRIDNEELVECDPEVAAHYPELKNTWQLCIPNKNRENYYAGGPPDLFIGKEGAREFLYIQSKPLVQVFSTYGDLIRVRKQMPKIYLEKKKKFEELLDKKYYIERQCKPHPQCVLDNEFPNGRYVVAGENSLYCSHYRHIIKYKEGYFEIWELILEE